MKKFNQVFKRVFAVLIVFALFVSFNVKADELENATGLTDNLATETEEKEREVELAPPAESTGEISSVDDSQYQSTENVGETVDVLPEANVPTDANEEDKSENEIQQFLSIIDKIEKVLELLETISSKGYFEEINCIIEIKNSKEKCKINNNEYDSIKLLIKYLENIF